MKKRIKGKLKKAANIEDRIATLEAQNQEWLIVLDAATQVIMKFADDFGIDVPMLEKLKKRTME